MKRYESLNPDTQDQVNAILPAIAKAFEVDDVKDIIPGDIRMRAWDCERRDHIKEETEDDTRNWGVQFLRDLQAIARLLKGDLHTFQTDLRAKVQKHEARHPWARLADVKELKVRYQNPGIPSEDDRSPNEYVSDDTSSRDSYFEELVEPEHSKAQKGRRRNHETYEARVVERPSKRHKRTTSRLRRDSVRWDRNDKIGRSSMGRYSLERRVPSDGRNSARHPSLATQSPSHETLSFKHSIDNSEEPLEVLKLQAELEVAEAELKATRIRFAYIQARERAAAEVQRNGGGQQNFFNLLKD